MRTLLAFVAALAVTVAQAEPLPVEKPPVATGLPQIVQDAIQEKGCESGPSTSKTGVVLEKDINGDGRKDYILYYSECKEGLSQYCGTGGCLTQVFASLSDGTYANVLDQHVREVRFARVKRRPAMILQVHGMACGREGAARCGVTLFWNGYEFNAAN